MSYGSSLLMGILMGIVGIIMIRVLSWLEDFFDHLPIKRALIWSPAIGAVILGVIGYFYPHVFGTSYDTIRDMLNDRLTAGNLLGISLAKFWALVISLGSGTTGGVFAPSLVVGGGIGAVFARAVSTSFPSGQRSGILCAGGHGSRLWRHCPRAIYQHRVSVRAEPQSQFAASTDCLRHDLGWLCATFSRDSIMTVKLVKRGLIVLQDYSVPVLMRARIDQVMRKDSTQSRPMTNYEPS